MQYERIDASEGINLNKTSASKECMLCHFWNYKNVGYKFERHVRNKCHDVLLTAYELKNIAILNVRGVDNRYLLWGISKNDAVSILNNSGLKKVHLEEHILETFIMVLTENTTESYANNNQFYQVIMMLELINMVLNVERP